MRSMAAVSLWFQALSYLFTNRLMSSSSDCFVCAKQNPQTARKNRTSVNLSFIIPPKRNIGCTVFSEILLETLGGWRSVRIEVARGKFYHLRLAKSRLTRKPDMFSTGIQDVRLSGWIL